MIKNRWTHFFTASCAHTSTISKERYVSKQLEDLLVVVVVVMKIEILTVITFETDCTQCQAEKEAERARAVKRERGHKRKQSGR